MYTYFYDETTKEYLTSAPTEQDPEETKIQGEFVPLIPANATLIKPMAALNNQIQVFNTDTQEWTLFNDYRKNFYKVDDYLNVFDIKKIGDIEQGFYLVDKATGDEIKANKDYFKIENGKVVEKTEEEIQADERKREAERIANLSLTKREVLLALYDDLSITPEQIKSMLDKRGAIEFEYAASYFRGNPLIDKLGTALGYTKEQLDYLFEHGKFEVA